MTYRDDLAGELHERMCAYSGSSCPRLKEGSPHKAYYDVRAQNLIEELEPLIGVANVIPVVHAVLGELDL